jgi:HD-GYP domain-containing protein (c-di-GMP phosphodiesterase class II)
METLSLATDVGYVPLDLQALGLNSPLTCDLYIREQGRYVLYRESSVPFTAIDQERLVEAGVDLLWVRFSREEEGVSLANLEALLDLSDSELPRYAKARLLYCSSLAVARRASATTLTAEVIDDVDRLVGVTVGELMKSESAFQSLLSVMQHDASTFTHIANVAVYALALGRCAGISDRNELQDLGLSAFLHDAGKSRLPIEILNKPGPLSVEEWLIVRQHPDWGRELLSKSCDLPELVLTTVAQHHERSDGSGYPNGLTEGDLHQFCRLVTLVDAFDALTSDRPYRASMQPYEALSLLKEESGLDPRLFAALVELLGRTRLIQSETPQ